MVSKVIRNSIGTANPESELKLQAVGGARLSQPDHRRGGDGAQLAFGDRELVRDGVEVLDRKKIIINLSHSNGVNPSVETVLDCHTGCFVFELLLYAALFMMKEHHGRPAAGVPGSDGLLELFWGPVTQRRV